MLEITLEFDRRAFDSAANSFVNGEVQTALVGAVNGTAERVRIALRNSMLTAFDRPKPFTLEGIAVYKATPRTDGGTPSALVFVRETQAGYLDLEMHGGVRRAGDVGTTRLGPLVPGVRAPKDRFGGLPRNFVAEALQDKDVAWVTLRPGEPPALVRKRPGMRMEVLAVIASETRYEATWDFYGTATNAIEEAWPQAGFPVWD